MPLSLALESATDLNSLIPFRSGLNLISAQGINDAGQIVCVATDADFNYHVVFLNPVPEPIMGAPFAALGFVLL